MASSRLTLQPGDFFKDSLPRCDAYILMEIIHDWPDDEAVVDLRGNPPSGGSASSAVFDRDDCTC
jgi:hypothetical protein